MRGCDGPAQTGADKPSAAVRFGGGVSARGMPTCVALSQPPSAALLEALAGSPMAPRLVPYVLTRRIFARERVSSIVAVYLSATGSACGSTPSSPLRHCR